MHTATASPHNDLIDELLQDKGKYADWLKTFVEKSRLSVGFLLALLKDAGIKNIGTAFISREKANSAFAKFLEAGGFIMDEAGVAALEKAKNDTLLEKIETAFLYAEAYLTSRQKKAERPLLLVAEGKGVIANNTHLNSFSDTERQRLEDFKFTNVDQFVAEKNKQKQPGEFYYINRGLSKD